MSVVDVKTKYAAADGEFTPDRRAYTVVYIAHTSNPLDGPQQVSFSSLIPVYYTYHGESDPYARIISVSPKKINVNTWEVTARYSTLPYDQSSLKYYKDQSLNPLAQMVRRRSTTAFQEEFPPTDLDGQAFRNSAGQLLQDGMAVKKPYIVRTYIRNEASFDEAVAKLCLWATNSAAIFDAGIGQVLCAKFDGGEVQVRNDIEYVEVTYEFWILGGTPNQETGVNTWKDRKIDCGTYSLDGEGKRVLPVDADDAKFIQNGTVFLDGSGQELGENDPVVWLVFRNYTTYDFTQLGLS